MPTQPKSAKTAKPSAATPFDAFNVNLPNVELTAVFRDIAEKSTAQARDGFANIKTAAEDATEMVEDTYETARQGAFAVGAKVLDNAQRNSEASFSLARDLFGATTFAEAIELQSNFARRQLGVLGSQSKEFQEITQKYVTDSTKQVERSLRNIKAA